MQLVLPEKVITLRNEIYGDIYKKSEWIYVKLQSLYEFMGRMFLESSIWDNEFLCSNPSGFEVFKYIDSRYIKKSKIAAQFYMLNERANLIKHNTDIDRLETAKFEIGFVKFCFDEYNQYIAELFKSDGRIYWLDLSIFTETSRATVSSVADEQQRKDNAIAKKPAERTSVSGKRTYSICCGAGKQDYGFQVHGIPAVLTCNNEEASLYATVFGFLQRSTYVRKDIFIEQREVRYGRILNLSVIFRYQMILLLMIRANLDDDLKLFVYPTDELELELQVAIESIMHYSDKLATLSGIFRNPVSILISGEGYKISASNDSKADVYTIDYESRLTATTREIWFERPIKYCIDFSDVHQEIIESLMSDFFGYTDFKPGQYKALIHMLNSSDNSLCIMPTGGGKSLIFYFVALMQPGSSLIISPTHILIEDQIRNMQTLHSIDDVQKVQDEDIYQKGHFSLNHKFIFLTPSDFQHYMMIYRIIELNNARKISGIVLDEVHTISNWSHDFRPDYLMLSFNLLTFADHPRLYGFTATANFRVVNDIKIQLALTEDSMVLPVELKRTDISFEYTPTQDESDFVEIFKDKVYKIAYGSKREKDKMLAFTKNEKQSIGLVEAIDEACKYNIDIFHADATDSYLGFIKGRKSVLVADASMGIGINLPDVYHIMHIGLPISKAQYVQEIGRASRFGHGATSSVVFKSKESMSFYERRVLDFNTSVDEILSILTILPDGNDVAYAFRSIFGHIENFTSAAKNINAIYEKLVSVDNCTILSFEVNNHDDISIRRQQVYLYFLHKMGVVYNWYIKNKSSDTIDYLIEVEHDDNRIVSVKNKSIEYISSLSPSKEIAYRIENADDIKTIILLVQEWYYNEFLYYHREQLLNILDFFEINASVSATNEEIISQLAEYFSVAISSSDVDELQTFSSLSIREMLEKSWDSQDSTLLSRIEHYLENQYHSKLDLFMFFNQFYRFSHFNKSRLERIVSQIDAVLWLNLMDNLFLMYRDCSDEEKLNMLNAISKRENEDQLLERIYEKNPLDIIYYAYFAKKVNQCLSN